MNKLSLVCFIAVLWTVVGCKSTTEQRYEIPSPPDLVLRNQEGTELVQPRAFNVPIIDNLNASGPKAELLENPDRGLRGEVYITLGSGKAYPSSSNDAFEYLEQELALFASDQIQIVQCYVYLSEFTKQDLSAQALDQLTAYFERLQKQNVRVLLRFAYDYSSSVKSAASTKQTLRHLDQIGAWIQEQPELFHSTVYAVQMGLVGLWGEGHGSSRKLDKEQIFSKLMEIIPPEVHVQIRLPEFFAYIPEEERSRVGVHDDFLVGIDHEWGMLAFTHPQYRELLNQNNYVLSDGEMPWGRDTTVPNIDQELLLKQVVDYSLSTLSAKHNYKEDGNSYFLEQAKQYFLDEIFLQEQGYPYNPFMIQAEAGKDTKVISLFDYLQYHLGYNLVVSNFSPLVASVDSATGSVNSTDSTDPVELTVKSTDSATLLAGDSITEEDSKRGEGAGTAQLLLTNFGLAAPHEFILELRVNGQLIPQPEYSPLCLIQFGQIWVNFPYAQGDFVTLRLVHRRDPSLTIRLANNLLYLSETGEHIIAGN